MKTMFEKIEETQKVLIGKISDINDFGPLKTVLGIKLNQNGVTEFEARTILDNLKNFKDGNWTKFRSDPNKIIISRKVFDWLKPVMTQESGYLMGRMLELKITEEEKAGISLSVEFTHLKDEKSRLYVFHKSFWGDFLSEINSLTALASIALSAISGSLLALMFHQGTLSWASFGGFSGVILTLITLISLLRSKWRFRRNKELTTRLASTWPREEWNSMIFGNPSEKRMPQWVKVDYGKLFSTEEVKNTLNRMKVLTIKNGGDLVLLLRENHSQFSYDPYEKILTIEGNVTLMAVFPHSIIIERDSLLTAKDPSIGAEAGYLSEELPIKSFL